MVLPSFSSMLHAPENPFQLTGACMKVNERHRRGMFLICRAAWLASSRGTALPGWPWDAALYGVGAWGTSVSEFWPGPKFLRFELVDEGQPYFLTANRPTNDWGPSSLKCSSGTPCDEHCCLWQRSEERCRYISTSSSSIASAACRHIDCSRATRCVYQRYILILGSQRHKSQPARSAAQLNSLIDGLEGGVRRTGNPRR